MQSFDWDGKKTPVLGFGCGSVMGRVGRSDSLRAMETAWEAGIRLFDTARSYGYGEAEGLLGEFLHGRREEAVVVTKFGIWPQVQPAWKRLAKPAVRAALRLVPAARTVVRSAVAGEMSHGKFDVATLRRSLEMSLRELRTEYVDALLLHLPPVSVFAQEDLIAELLKVVSEGKVKRIGVSTEDLATQRHFLEKSELTQVLQFPFPVLALEVPHPEFAADGKILMANHLFGGAALAERVAAKIAELAYDDTVAPELRTKLEGDAKARVAEIVFGSARADSGASVFVASMLKLEHVQANVAAMESERFSRAELVNLRRLLAES